MTEGHGRVVGFGVRLEECSKWTVPLQQNYEVRMSSDGNVILAALNG